MYHFRLTPCFFGSHINIPLSWNIFSEKAHEQSCTSWILLQRDRRSSTFTSYISLPTTFSPLVKDTSSRRHPSLSALGSMIQMHLKQTELLRHFSFEGEDCFQLQAIPIASKQDHISRYCSFLSPWQTPREQQVPTGVKTHYARGLSIEPYVFNFTEDASVTHNWV